MFAAALDARTKALLGPPSNDQALIWELLEAEAVALGVAVQIPIVQPVAVFKDNIEEAVNDDADFWDEIGGPEVPIFQEVVDQSEFIRQQVRVQIREYRLLPPMAMKVDLGGKKEFSNPLD